MKRRLSQPEYVASLAVRVAGGVLSSGLVGLMGLLLASEERARFAETWGQYLIGSIGFCALYAAVIFFGWFKVGTGVRGVVIGILGGAWAAMGLAAVWSCVNALAAGESWNIAFRGLLEMLLPWGAIVGAVIGCLVAYLVTLGRDTGEVSGAASEGPNAAPPTTWPDPPREPFQFDVRALFALTLVAALCVWFFVVWGRVGLPVAGIFAGGVVWLWANMHGWSLLRNIALIVTLLSLCVLLAVLLLFAWVLWLIAAGIVAAMVWVALRRSDQQGLLCLLAAAAEQRAPLAPAVWAFSHDCPAIYGRRVRRLAVLLQKGHALHNALCLVRRVLPGDCAAAARVGAETGQLGRALKETAAHRAALQPLRTAVHGRLLYFWFVLLAMAGVGAFFFVKIAPTYERIFKDFDQELPGVTQVVFSFSPNVMFGAWLGFPLFVALVAFLLWKGWLPGSFRRRLDAAVVLRTLSFCATREAPLILGIRALGDLHPSGRVRRRLLKLKQMMNDGEDWCDGLRRQRIITAAEAGVLKAAAQAGNLAFALRELAAGAERRYVYRLQALLSLVTPWVVLAVGLVVLVFVLACFLPLIHIIEGNVPW
jgi:type II secretory pathway component PulF